VLCLLFFQYVSAYYFFLPYVAFKPGNEKDPFPSVHAFYHPIVTILLLA